MQRRARGKARSPASSTPPSPRDLARSMSSKGSPGTAQHKPDHSRDMAEATSMDMKRMASVHRPAFMMVAVSRNVAEGKGWCQDSGGPGPCLHPGTW